MDYSELVKQLRYCANCDPICDMTEVCQFYDQRDEEYGDYRCVERMMENAADAIEELEKAVEREKTYTQFWEYAAKTCKVQYEELLRAAKKMHTWIFLNGYDEQEAYDECGLSDEMNAALGYGGRFELRAEQPKEEA